LVGSETQNISNCDRLTFYSGLGSDSRYIRMTKKGGQYRQKRAGAAYKMFYIRRGTAQRSVRRSR